MRGITPTAQTLSAVAITVHFAFDSSAILPESAQNLRSVGIALQSSELASARIQIEGHTDGIGSDQYNLRLSERRAGSVRQYLVRQYRIAPERLIAVGKGKAESIADNDTPEGRQKNRRVESEPGEELAGVLYPFNETLSWSLRAGLCITSCLPVDWGRRASGSLDPEESAVFRA